MRTGPIIDVAQIILDAQAEAMDRLIQAWDEEIEAAFQALKEQQAKINAELLQRSVDEGRRTSKEVLEAIQLRAAESSLAGMLDTAEDSGSTINATAGLPTAAITKLASLVSQVQEEVREGTSDSPLFELQQSIAEAMDKGLVPHPGQLGQLFESAGLRSEAHRAHELSEQLARLNQPDRGLIKNPEIKYRQQHDRIGTLQSTVKLLTQFGPQNMVGLLTGTGAASKSSIAPALNDALNAFQTRR